MELINSKKKFHIYLLDIEMNGLNGFQVGRILNKNEKVPVIIYISSHTEFIQEGYKYNAFRYLYKPINDKQLFEALKSATNKIFNNTNIIIKDNDKKILLGVEKIIYIESMGEGSCVMTHDKYYVQKETLKHWIEILPESEFVQTHRSYIVNMKYINEFSVDSLLLSCGAQIPLSTRNQKKFKNKVLNYISCEAIKL
jgi:DNA-binding LytR/AlgR family response regulator